LNELFHDAQGTSLVILAFEEQYKSIGCQVCKDLGPISATGQLQKFPRKSNWWDMYLEPVSRAYGKRNY
jgi:hypothetical protein